jgi:ABC-type transporter Mla subunit MlaD
MSAPGTRFGDLVRIRWFKALLYIGESLASLHNSVDTLNAKLETVMINQAEAAAAVNALVAKLEKVSGETTAIVTALAEAKAQLEAAVAAGGAITPELKASIEAAMVLAEAIDAKVPDAV